MKEVKINLNDMVKFKLTDRGKDIWRHRYDDIFRNRSINWEPTMPKVDEDGYTTCQLHDFMWTFGKYMTVGMKNVIEPIDLIFEVEE